MTYAVNVAAPFLLTACLLGAVRERVVNVASISAASSIDFANLQQVGEWDVGRGAGTQAGGVPHAVPPPCIRSPGCSRRLPLPPPLPFPVPPPPAHHSPRIKQERGYSAHGAYSLSKLADMLFTFGLAARLQAAGSPLTCNCLDPGEGLQCSALAQPAAGA